MYPPSLLQEYRDQAANTEPALRLDADEVKEQEQRSKRLPLVEMFGPTIQGEGTVIGQQTFFLRFGLCDYKCKMCDSMHAVNPALVKQFAHWHTQEEIADIFRTYTADFAHHTNWVTFSGGNPAIHDLENLVKYIHDMGFKINVETQGTRYHRWLSQVDSLTISPKGPGMGESHRHSVFAQFLDQLCNDIMYNREEGQLNLVYPKLCFKIVVFDQRDVDFASDIFRWLYTDECPLHAQLPSMDDCCYLSLGNPNPPPTNGTVVQFDIGDAIARYRMLCEDILVHPVLSHVRFLPQWHAFVWGNDQGH